MPHSTICPKCHVETQVSDSLVGRFVTCENCRCLYYVVAPRLGEEQDESQRLLSVPAIGQSRSASPASPTRSIGTPSKPSDPATDTPSEQSTLETRYARLMTLLTLNLLIGAAVLVLEVVRLLK